MYIQEQWCVRYCAGGSRVQKKGFTLLELLFVFIIINFLVALAMPQYIIALEKARSIEAIINIGSLRTAIHRYWYEQSVLGAAYYPASLDTLDINNPNNNPDRFFNYYITDESTAKVKNYIIRAERIGFPELYWVEWIQVDNNTGKFVRSRILRGLKDNGRGMLLRGTTKKIP